MTILDTATVGRPLSAAMRDGSHAEHEQAEGSVFMAELLGGRINSLGYTDYLLRLRQVYETLERTGRELCGDGAVAAVVDPDLERLPAIDADLAYWSAVRIVADTEPVNSPAATAYCARIEATAAEPSLFVAHHYTRYLGDLSGGQAIGRILSRTFDLDGAGAAFYHFDAVPKPKPYKDAYRARLDALDLVPRAKQRIVDEVKVAFRLNSDLFSELGLHLEDYRR